MDRLWDLYDLLCNMTDEVVKTGDMSPSELDNVYKATKAMYYITCIDAMNNANDEYEGSSMACGMSRNYPYSSTRGNSYRRSSRTNNSMRNYSGHDKKEMLMQRIAELQDEIDRMEG